MRPCEPTRSSSHKFRSGAASSRSASALAQVLAAERDMDLRGQRVVSKPARGERDVCPREVVLSTLGPPAKALCDPEEREHEWITCGYERLEGLFSHFRLASGERQISHVLRQLVRRTR